MINLMLGDCLELMRGLPDSSVDLILCDLPYGITQCRWDSIIPLDALWLEYKRIIKPNAVIALTACQPFTTTLISSNIKMFKYVWVWSKKSSTGFLNAKIRPLRSHEDIVIFSKGKPVYYPIMTVRGIPRQKGSYNKRIGDGDGNYGKFQNVQSVNNKFYPKDVIEISNAQQAGKVHPTQKPVELMEYLIKTYTQHGGVVLDNCMGSGTTGVACKNTGRDFIGMELDPDYFAIAEARINSI
jgi:site-specific DNA-methyltransferase (adenine-specific)